ncbi:hypothetical protein Bca4012_020585 [Brassica carinata]
MPVDTRRRLSLFSFKSVINVTDGSLYKKTNMVDILGAIVKVEKLMHTSPIRNEFWDIKFERIVYFTIRDLNGQNLRCIACGCYSDMFENLWITRSHKDVNICILRFWRIDRELGSDQFIVRAVKNISELLFDPPVVEAIHAKYKMLSNPDFQCNDDRYSGGA